jgi:tetratricopeptide (TPR) repeat protein
MNTLNTRAVSRPSVLSRKLVKLERCGRYEDALGLISDNWDGRDDLPDFEAMPQLEAAHLQLRYGALIGFHGHSSNISGSQARSKDLLTSALEVFSAAGDAESITECENYIALAYWRTGEYREAETWIDHALAHEISPHSDVRLYSHIIKSLVLMETDKHEENVAYCRSVEETFRLEGDAFLNGCFFANLGISLKDLGRTQDALANLDLAKAFQERSRHRPYLGTINNNLALLYKDVGRFHMAHFSVDKAIAIYRRIGDKAREGSSLETKSQVFLAEGNPGLAHTVIDRSIAMLRQSENLGYLAESILHKAKIFLAQGNFADAVLNLLEAVEIARNQSGEPAAREMIAEFKAALDTAQEASDKPRQMPKTGDIELVLPPEIAHHTNYQGVWVHNSHLNAIGISQGMLALVVDEPLERGQPGAVLHTASGEVSCGFYDADFGIVALEGGDDEPQLFGEEDVKVLGKIVAVCRETETVNGRMIVHPISC